MSLIMDNPVKYVTNSAGTNHKSPEYVLHYGDLLLLSNDWVKITKCECVKVSTACVK